MSPQWNYLLYTLGAVNWETQVMTAPPNGLHCPFIVSSRREGFICLFPALLPVLRASNTWHLVVANKHLLTAGRTLQDSRRVPSGRDVAFEGLREGGGRGLSPWTLCLGSLALCSRSACSRGLPNTYCPRPACPPLALLLVHLPLTHLDRHTSTDLHSPSCHQSPSP